MVKMNSKFLQKMNCWTKRWIKTVLGAALVTSLLASQLPAGQVVAEPDVDPDHSIFGVQTFEYTDQGGAHLIRLPQTDTAWVRGFELVWSELEPGDPSDPWELPASLVDQVLAARGDGLEPILIVRSTPEWAWKYEGSYCGPIAEDKFTDFADFIVEALGKFPVNGKITYLEIWNEPDVAWEDVAGNRPWGGCWGERLDTEYYGGDYYAEMLKVVYPAVKAAFPEVQILIGGLQMECNPGLPLETCVPPGTVDPPTWRHNSTKFFDGILAGGGGPYFDGVSFHAYDYHNPVDGRGFGSTPWNSYWNTTGPVIEAKVNYLQSTLATYGVTGKYLINTENSLLSGDWVGNDEFEETKAGYLVKAYAQALNLQLRANLWFELVGRWDRGTGLLSPSLEEYPAYRAYQVASEKLYGVTPNGKLNLNSSITGYEFRTPGGLLWIVWSQDGEEHQVHLNNEPLAVYDIYGNEFNGPIHPIRIDYQPLYIEFPSIIKRQFMPVLSHLFSPLVNGTFDSGMTGWRWINAGLPASLVTGPVINPITGENDPYFPAGANIVLLGQTDFPCDRVPIGFAGIEQTITIPRDADIDQINLLFDYIIYTEDISANPGAENYDRFEVILTSGNNQVILFDDANEAYGVTYGCYNWHRIPGIGNPRENQIDGWATGTIDLTGYKGLTITLSFQNHSRYDGNYNTYTYLDNIRLVTTP